MNNEKKANNLYVLYFFIKELFRYSKLTILLILITTSITCVIPFLHLYYPKKILDSLYLGYEVDNIISTVVVYALLIMCTGFFTNYIRGIYEAKLRAFQAMFSRRHVKKCMSVPYMKTEDANFLDIAWKTRRTIESRLYKVLRSYPDFLAKIGTILMYFIVLITFDFKIVLLITLNIVVVFFSTKKAKIFEFKSSHEISKYDRRGQYAFDIMNDFAIGKEVRLYNLKNFLLGKFTYYRNKSMNISHDIEVNYYRVELLNTILTIVRNGIIMYYLINLTVNQEIIIGSVLLYFNATVGLAELLRSTISDFNNHINDSRLLSEVYEFLDTSYQTNLDNQLDRNHSEVGIKFKRVSFKYPNTDKYILKDFTLSINPGESLAIVGLNGSGKTTLVKLLFKFYEIESGEIWLGDKNIEDMEDYEITEYISVIFQDFAVFAFTILENISLSNTEPDSKRLKKILTDIGFDHKIDSLNNGIKTSISKELDPHGVDLSGGERQLLALSRALYKKSKISILDEPMACLDPLVEDMLYRLFSKSIIGKTAILISHRLASTTFCDRVAYIKNGTVCEVGTHEELMIQGNEYSKLYKTQANNYYENDELAEEV